MSLMRRRRLNTQRESHAPFVWKISTRLLLLISGLLLCILSRPACVAQQNAKNVLFVFSSADQQHRDLDSFEKGLRTRVPQHLNFYTSYIDFERMVDASYRDSLAETFHHAYKNVKLDVAVVSSIEALRFVTQYRDRILPGVPIVFYSLSAKELEGQQIPAGVTGTTTDVGLRETIDLALRLHPDAQAVAIITEGPGFWWKVAQSELYRHRDRVKEIDLFGPPSEETLDKIAALPPHTLILFQLAKLSARESDIKPNDVLAAAAKHLPTYCAWKGSFILGCIGGAYTDGEKNIDSSAATAARVLSGERPENIPVVNDSNFQPQVDWRELRRWHIPESTLPSGAVILYREPSLWERGRDYLIPAIGLILGQAILIAALLWQRARKRKAEAVMRESEKRFRVMTDTTPSLVWMCDSHGKITYRNERLIAFTGPDPTVGFSDAWASYVHPDDRQNLLDTVAQALKNHKSFSTECRLRRSDGVYRWMLAVASPRVNGDGSFAGLIASAVDVTDQKLAQQSLEKMSGRLIEAQEQERSRIARELHDDICQRLALLSLEIDEVHVASVDANTTESLEQIGRLCREIGSDVQGLSHQLHSSILDYLGVASAVKGFCDEMSKQYDLQIEFSARDVPKQLPKDISLCLFRVAQEALHNAVKYSGISEFTVELVGTRDVVQLMVTDRGAGFDPEDVRQHGGLGLVSMQERVHLVHGTFLVDSAPGEGTRILVAVPLGVPERKYAEDDSTQEITRTQLY
ncbi:PAS domain S-box-containing protein [Edaphobacter aggregans]|uniref:Oxygen sensor histidine kinase NreB n=1 Tax=Edaphobacter aggregans TaxID=570835 RepID=A0A3R9PSQ9_9BACT|nr:PAS domain S-box-containing protein [Edaphobacter aggregans]